MRTRSQARRLRQQQQVPPNLVEPPKDTMADNRTMAELLQAPTEGYEDAIVVPEIAAANFEIKHGLLTLVQNKQFFGHDKEDPHAHIRYFNKITSTLRYPNVPTTSIKLMLFPFSLEGAARIWLEKEPPRSIQTWDDLVAKFINQFFPPSKTTNLRNEITNFKQRFDESFSEAWDRFKDLLRACPHHGFSELHQLDTPDAPLWFISVKPNAPYGGLDKGGDDVGSVWQRGKDGGGDQVMWRWRFGGDVDDGGGWRGSAGVAGNIAG
ncbi:reverse transcriptase domain-containing protein [Tanacetum coccineum]